MPMTMLGSRVRTDRICNEHALHRRRLTAGDDHRSTTDDAAPPGGGSKLQGFRRHTNQLPVTRRSRARGVSEILHLKTASRRPFLLVNEAQSP